MKNKDVTRNSSLAVAATSHPGSLLSQLHRPETARVYSVRNRTAEAAAVDWTDHEPAVRDRGSRLDGSQGTAGKMRGAI